MDVLYRLRNNEWSARSLRRGWSASRVTNDPDWVARPEPATGVVDTYVPSRDF